MRLPGTDAAVWVDGRRTTASEAAIPIDDAAFHAGLGLFETLAVKDCGVLDLDEHLQRLAAGASALRVALPESEGLSSTVLEAARPFSCGWLKIAITRGGHSFVFAEASDPADEGRPASAVLLPWRRNARDPLSALKSLNYAANVLGTEEARRRCADEGLWLNTRGHLAEGCSSNLFVIRRRALFTPAVRDGILPGVVRAHVLRASREAGLIVHEGKLRLVRLERADEAFLTSSVRGVRPLIEYEGRPVGAGRPGPVTRVIAGAVSAMRRRTSE